MGHTATLVCFVAASACFAALTSCAGRARWRAGAWVVAGFLLAIGVADWRDRNRGQAVGIRRIEWSSGDRPQGPSLPYHVGGMLAAAGLLGMAAVRPWSFGEPVRPVMRLRPFAAANDLGTRFRDMIRNRDLDPDLLDEAERARGTDPMAAAGLLTAIVDPGFDGDVDELLQAAGRWLEEADSVEEAADLVDRLHRLRRLLHALETSHPATGLRAA